MSLKQQYTKYDALGLAELIKKKEISALELLEAVIENSEAINPKINAVQWKMYDEAKSNIANIDINSPFAGVPFLIKDLGTMQKNAVTSQGSLFFQNIIGEYDSEIVKRFKKSGFNIFGKSHTSELGMSYDSVSSLYGACKNPLNLNYAAGGSSGGAAAAVAANIIPAAHASDGGGSIRVPAACCGLFGLKPTRARVPCGPAIGEGWAGLSASHVITKTVRDSAAILDCISGPEIGDPYSAPYHQQSYLSGLKKPLNHLRVATHIPNLPYAQLDPVCEKAVITASKHCEQLGFTLVDKPFPDVYVNMQELIQIIVPANFANFIDWRANILNKKPTIKDLPVAFIDIYEHGKNISAIAYIQAITAMHQYSRQIAAYFKDIDLLITPVLAKPNLPVSSVRLDNVEHFYQDLLAFAPYTSIWNQTGQPAMSLPILKQEIEIPISVQFISRFGAEDLLLNVAAQLEKMRT